MAENEIYKYNDELFFRLNSKDQIVLRPLDEKNVEFVCPKHRVAMPNIDINWGRFGGFKLVCPVCERDKGYKPLSYEGQEFEDLQRKAFAMYEARDLKNAKLIRLDDVYTPEIKRFDALSGKNASSNYSIKADVKEDVEGHSIVILYLSYKGKKEKTQFFVKPEKLQLSHDHKDMDPAKILAKIELTLKDRIITQSFDGDKK